MTDKTITEKNFASKAKLLASSGLKANQLAHELGVYALTLASSNGDTRPIDRVYQAMQEGHLRAEGFRAWVGMFSPIRWNGDGKVGVMKAGSKGFKAYDIPTATAKPFWTVTKEKVEKELSIEQLVKMFTAKLKSIETADAEGKVYDKDGQLSYTVKGNIITAKAFASKTRAYLLEQQASTAAVDAAVSVAHSIPATTVEAGDDVVRLAANG